MSNAVMSDWPSGVANTGWPSEPSAMLMPGRVQGWPAGTQRAANAAERLLSQAVAWWDVEQYRDGDRFLRNRGTGGELLDLRLGSSIAANSNDPLYLPVEDRGYAYLSGVSGNFLSVPDENALDITGDIDIRCRVALDDWTPSANMALLAKADTGQLSYSFHLTSTGLLRLRYSTDGSTLIQRDSTTATGIADGDARWVRVTVDVDNAGNNDVKFWTSTDNVTYTQLGNTVTNAGTTSFWSGSAVLKVGRDDQAGAQAAGKFYRAQVLDGIDGTTVLDIDCNEIASGSATSFTALTGQTVTINRSTSGRKSVAVPSRHKGGRPVMLLGTDDYLEIPAENGWQHGLLNFDQGQSFTVVASVRHWATLNRSAGLVTKSDLATGANRWLLSTNAGGVAFGYIDSLNSQSAIVYGATAAGTVQTYAGVLDRASQTISTVNNGTRGTTVDTKSVVGQQNYSTVRIGKWASVFFDGEFYAAAIFRRALSPAEITLLSNYYAEGIA